MSLPNSSGSLSLKYRLRSLKEKIERKSLLSQRIEAKINGPEPVCTLKPSRFRKLLCWITQLSKLREEETNIIAEISEIEQKHEAMRKAKQLRKAKPLLRVLDAPMPEPKRGSKWLFELVVFWALFMDDKKPSPK